MGLRRFLGLINFYHTFIPNLAAIEVPLTDLMQGAKKKDKRRVDWTPERIDAFVNCKRSLANATSMSFLAPEAHLILATDASSTDLGGALNQLIENIWQPLGFFSRKLTKAEKNYSPYDRELLAVFASLKFSPRQLNQLEYISQFCATFQYIPGERNVVADALSRVEAIDMPSLLNSEAIFKAQQEENVAEDHELASSSLIL